MYEKQYREYAYWYLGVKVYFILGLILFVHSMSAVMLNKIKSVTSSWSWLLLLVFFAPLLLAWIACFFPKEQNKTKNTQS